MVFETKSEYLEVAWLDGHQSILETADTAGNDNSSEEVRIDTHFVIVDHLGDGNCNPFLLVDLPTLRVIAPRLVDKIFRLDPNEPQVDDRLRSRPFYIPRDCVHPLAKKVQAIRIFAILHAGKYSKISN